MLGKRQEVQSGVRPSALAKGVLKALGFRPCFDILLSSSRTSSLRGGSCPSGQARPDRRAMHEARPTPMETPRSRPHRCTLVTGANLWIWCVQGCGCGCGGARWGRCASEARQELTMCNPKRLLAWPSLSRPSLVAARGPSLARGSSLFQRPHARRRQLVHRRVAAGHDRSEAARGLHPLWGHRLLQGVAAQREAFRAAIRMCLCVCVSSATMAQESCFTSRPPHLSARRARMGGALRPVAPRPSKPHKVPKGVDGLHIHLHRAAPPDFHDFCTFVLLFTATATTIGLFLNTTCPEQV